MRWEAFARRVTEHTGRPWAFGAALLVVLVWFATGPLFDYSETWQLLINTGTTIVTFLMVFVVQRSQSKDTRAMELKLDELVAAIANASNRVIAAEELTAEELDELCGRVHEEARRSPMCDEPAEQAAGVE
jgi:low affinity Fe/Cu permease